MNRYKVTGTYTISFEVEVEAENWEEAQEIGQDISIVEGANGSIFCQDDDVELHADGTVQDVEAELIEGEEPEED